MKLIKKIDITKLSETAGEIFNTTNVSDKNTNTYSCNIIENLLLNLYPVGSVYISTNSTDPSTLFGGTWERITDTFLYATSDDSQLGNTGGEATHTLTTAELPAHTHGSKTISGYFQLNGGGITVNNTTISTVSEADGTIFTRNGISRSGNPWISTQWNTSTYTSYEKVSLNATHEHTSVGSGNAHNNMPPYLVVCMWKRTA